MFFKIRFGLCVIVGVDDATVIFGNDDRARSQRAGSQEEKMNVKLGRAEKSLTCKCSLYPRKWTET